MCWGISCGDGWYWLLDSLCSRLQNLTEEENKPQIEVTQVKQKFGGLRFYITCGDDVVYNIIDFAEYLSYSICEECGSMKNVHLTKEYWIQSLCEECHDKKHKTCRFCNCKSGKSS